jgi:predicted ATPase/DNA-binding SARP family transcriptional activator
MLEVRLLGQFEIKHGQKTVSIQSRPAQSLFAFLILNAGTAYRREKLAGQLWPDSTEESARDYLRHALWRIRKALQTASSESFLKADDLAISFGASADYWLDAAAFQQVSEHVSPEELIAALSVYKGELLPGFYDEWAVLEREHLQAKFEHEIGRLLDLLQGAGRWLDVVVWAEKWIALGQKPESAYRHLISAFAAQGDMAKAAAVYERCVKSLAAFGVGPSEETRRLYEDLKAGKRPKLTQPKPLAAESTGSVFWNVPRPLTSFVGRENEIAEVVRLLDGHRLITLTGPGGVGKTRLAIETAHHSEKKFKDGVFWVGLVGLSDGNLIPQEIAQSLNVRDVSDEQLLETLKRHLKSKDLLLVLDNCEHLIKACAQYAEHLLATCPRLRILATSIEALGLFNEMTWQVPSLPLPEVSNLSLNNLKGFASIELFNERAGIAKSGFSLDEKNAVLVAQICRRLDGIPLAIELAAARIKILSVDEIASRLDDRFSLLTAGSRTAIPRHQTLRATIDWSYDLLTEPERMLMQRLSVFVGGFTLEAAEAVCSQGMKQSDILDLLGKLVDKSLIIVENDSEVSGTRFRLLETIRLYSLEKLEEIGELQTIRDGHLKYFMKLAQEAAPNAFGAESVRYYLVIDRELDNLRSAIEWSVESHQVQIAFRLVAELSYFWYNRPLLGEWHERLKRVLSLPEGLERTAERAKAINALGFFYWAGMSTVNPYRELEEALSIGRDLGNDHIIAQSLWNLGRNETTAGNYSKARSLFEQSLGIWQKLGHEHRMEMILTLNFLGDLAFQQGDLEEAKAVYQESVSAFKEIRDQNFLAYAVRHLGQVACRQGEFEKAVLLCGESLSLNQSLKDERGVISCLSAFAGIAVARSKGVSASRLFGAVEALLGMRNIRLLPVDQMEFDHYVSTLRSQVAFETLDQAWAEGRAMTFEQGMEFALNEANQ